MGRGWRRSACNPDGSSSVRVRRCSPLRPATARAAIRPGVPDGDPPDLRRRPAAGIGSTVVDASLAGKVALVAGATRGAGRGIAVRARRGRRDRLRHRAAPPGPQRSEMNRPETIEETAALVDEAGGRGIAVQVDHLVPDEVAALVARIDAEQGAPARPRERHLGRHHDGVGQDGVGVVAGDRAAHPAPRRRHPRHHQPLRPPAAHPAAGRPRRRGDRRDRRVQRHELPGLVLLRPGQGGEPPHGVRPGPRAGAATAPRRWR